MEQKDRIRFLYNRALTKYDSIVKNLDKIMINNGEHPEGNSFHIDGRHYEIARTFKTKRYNLFNEAITSTNIAEIGFNGGHSCLLFLLANQYSNIQIFDLGYHSYSKKCYEFLNIMFPNRLNVMWGDSSETLPCFEVKQPFDMIHIDGGHKLEFLQSDIKNCKLLSSPNTLVIIDDISYHPDHANRELTGDVVNRIVSGELLEYLPLFQCPYHVLVKYNFKYKDSRMRCEHDFVEQE